MARRKQRHPQANIGPIETRHEQQEPEEPASKFDIDAWEEEHAIYVRQRKKAKKAGVRHAIQVLRSDICHTQFGVIEAVFMGDDLSSSPIERIPNELEVAIDGCMITFSAASAVDPTEWRMRSVSPSEHEAVALQKLLQCGYVTIGPIAFFPPLTMNTGTASGLMKMSVALALADKSFESSAKYAEDQSRRAFNAHLLTLLRWLRPDAGLDPGDESDGPVSPSSDPVCVASGIDDSKRQGHDHSGVELNINSSYHEYRGDHRAHCAHSNQLNKGGQPSIPPFDAAELYRAVKPTGKEPELAMNLPLLKPTLRKYQKRAAQWMVDRERGRGSCPSSSLNAVGGFRVLEGETEHQLPVHPLWREVRYLTPPSPPPPQSTNNVSHIKEGGHAIKPASCFYINHYTGLLSRERFEGPASPKGGIASDEMGLGKTIEVLALIFANPYTGPPPSFLGAEGVDVSSKQIGQHVERIDCICGVYATNIEEDIQYQGMWLQCEACLAWQHGACVGHPRRAPAGDYICGPCLKRRAEATVTQQCGTTLIVCPTPILRQWWDEIHRHTHLGALKVMIYEGQPQPGAPRAPTSRGGCPAVVTAADLAAVDIVLTTYDVLRRDLHHSPNTRDYHGDATLGQRFSLRRRKKYEVIPTPLTRLRFWRVAIDEAQMVESSTAKAAAMALKLDCEHRWCVTGTPLSRGLEDLHGLMAFLKFEPYATKAWWTKCIQKPCEGGSMAGRSQLLTLLRPRSGGILWRSSKADVAHELDLPPQRHHLSQLQFSAIERHFYSRQHKECVGQARVALSASTLAAAQRAAASVLLDTTQGELGGEDDGQGGGVAGISTTFEDRFLTQKEEHKVLHPLLRLRQACVHPQVGAGGIRALSNAKTPMTMSEVLDVLITKAKIEAEDAQRVLLASLNGLAGLLLLQGHIAEAVRAYREAIKTVEGNAELVRADKLQQLHTMHNLAEILEGPAKGLDDVPCTLKDGSLRASSTSLREEYLAESVAKLAAADAELKDALAAPEKIASTLRTTVGREADTILEKWWVDAIHMLVTYASDEGSGVVQHIKDQLSEADTYRQVTARNASSIAGRFRTMHGLQMLLNNELKDMAESRKSSLTQLLKLQQQVANPSHAMVQLAASCERCRSETSIPGRVCDHCRLDDEFMGWEVRLFSLRSFAREAGQRVTAEEAVRMAQVTTLARVGRGGLGEETGPCSSIHTNENAVWGRRTEAVANSNIVRGPSEAEQVLRMLSHQLRILRVPTASIPQRDMLAVAAKAHLETLEAWRREFLQARATALEQRQKLYALDELDMCTTRMALRAPGESVTKADEVFKMHEAQIPVKSTELSADKAVASADLKRTLGTLRYLQGLKGEQERKAAMISPQKVGDVVKKGRNSSEDNGAEMSLSRDGGHTSTGLTDADACPVCHDPFGQEMVMLPCGHRLCCKCQLLMTETLPAAQPAASKRMGCPTCRARVPLSDIAFIVAAPEEAHQGMRMNGSDSLDVSVKMQLLTGDSEDGVAWSGESAFRVQGSYGTKLEAVVRRVMAILQSDENARILIFSSWKDSLELVSHALTRNAVPYIYPRGSNHFDAAVARFQNIDDQGAGSGSAKASAPASTAPNTPSPPRVLLLMVKQGGNGLNLQQAQHVVLVEPLLDPAEEAQAIGRVDRLGQTHTTHVHRFVVTHSVEENVYRLGQHRAAAMDLSASAVRRGKAGGERGALTVRDVAALLAESGDHHRQRVAS